MNYNDKKNNAEIDDMNIKSHLNTSLDLSGIQVSEDLINRTLSAIKQQQEEHKDGEDSRGQKDSRSDSRNTQKIVPWSRYIRTAAGVAAALIVVVVGYGAIKVINTDFGNKNDSIAYDSSTADDNGSGALKANSEAEKENSALMTSPESAEESTADMAAESTASDEATSAQQFTITAADALEEDEVNVTYDAATGETGSTGSAANQSESGVAGGGNALTKNSETLGREAFVTFREIFLPDPTQAEYIKITDEINKIEITLTKQEDILDFYSVMDQQQFTNGTDAPVEQNYKVELKSPEPGEAFYTMTIGETVVVNYEAGETVSQSYYNVSDLALLKQNLDDFFQKYSSKGN